MAFISKRIINGKTYYYYVENKRINGKVKTIQQTYLGSAEKILELCRESSNNLVSAVHQSFGDVSALYQIAEELKIVEIINHYVKRKNSKIDVGKYLLLGAINRCVSPTSKNGIGDWYKKTILPSLLEIPQKRVTSQDFWQAMDCVDESGIKKIEERLLVKLSANYEIDLSALLYDTTNFYTYIQSHTDSKIAKRGNNKAGKNNLRQVGLALCITKSYGIPLIHKLYEGNTNDAKLFPQAFGEIIERYRKICLDIDKLTMVFDKGNNSEKNFKDPIFSQIHFVGSLVPSRYKELLTIPLKKYTEIKLPNDKVVKAYHCEKEVFGSNKKLVITYNEDLFEKQRNTLKAHLQKAGEELLSTHWAKVKDKDKKIQNILTHYKIKDLIDAEVKDNSVSISHNKELIKERELSFGKNILFTNRFDWSAEEVIIAYRSASEIENTFKIMNDEDLVSFSPIFHWTDQKIRVHAFICILGLLLMRLVQMKLSKNGLAMSLNVMMNELEDIKSILLLDKNGSHSQIISKRSSVQQKMFKVLDLSTIASNLYLHF